MGAIANAVLEHGAQVTGIIPEFLTSRERMLRTPRQDLIVTEDLHERKRVMFERADAFVALPGGVGTLEELVEQMTWAQLGRHKKPILVANIKGFWDPLLRVARPHGGAGNSSGPALTVNYLVADKVEDILPRLMEAARSIPEEAKEMKAASVERM